MRKDKEEEKDERGMAYEKEISDVERGEGRGREEERGETKGGKGKGRRESEKETDTEEEATDWILNKEREWGEKERRRSGTGRKEEEGGEHVAGEGRS